MFKAYKQGWRRYFDFSGCASRTEFWTFFIVNSLIAYLLVFLFFLFTATGVYSALNDIHGFNHDYMFMHLWDNWDFTMIKYLLLNAEVLFPGVLLAIAWGLFVILCFIPTLALVFRRLHDTNRSGFYFLLFFVPFVGSLILFVLMVLPSVSNSRFRDADAFF